MPNMTSIKVLHRNITPAFERSLSRENLMHELDSFRMKVHSEHLGKAVGGYLQSALLTSAAVGFSAVAVGGAPLVAAAAGVGAAVTLGKALYHEYQKHAHAGFDRMGTSRVDDKVGKQFVNDFVGRQLRKANEKSEPATFWSKIKDTILGHAELQKGSVGYALAQKQIETTIKRGSGRDREPSGPSF